MSAVIEEQFRTKYLKKSHYYNYILMPLLNVTIIVQAWMWYMQRLFRNVKCQHKIMEIHLIKGKT